jgi:hypothetical protein
MWLTCKTLIYRDSIVGGLQAEKKLNIVVNNEL